MTVRATMNTLIARVRSLVYDPAGASQVFDDQTLQDILDDSRIDLYNLPLAPRPTFSGATVQYLDYFSEHYGNWEEDYTLKQYLTTPVTPTLAETISGHFQFAASTLPPVLITGKSYDCYRAAADVLERWAARYAVRFDFSSDGQSFKLSQAPAQLQALAATYRQKQRVGNLALVRGDLAGSGELNVSLGPNPIDYMT